MATTITGAGARAEQTLSYLKASGYTIGLLINFGSARLQVRRLAN